MALCSFANWDIIAKIDVPILGSLEGIKSGNFAISSNPLI
jgi:hypothetical protein